MLKASSLFYAILICTLTAGFCASIFIIYESSHKLNTIHNYKSSLYQKCLIDFNKQLSYPNSSIESSHFENWGLLTILNTQIIHRLDTITKSGFVGKQNIATNRALTLLNTSSVLKLEGNTQINGDIYTNSYGYERGYHFNSISSSKKLVTGKTIKINNANFQPREFVTPKSSKIISLEDIPKNKPFFNSFHKPLLTILTNKITLLDHGDYSGKLLITSTQELHIGANCKLDNVIIKAPSVIFKSGFRGNCQVFSPNIILEPNTTLEYPSCFYSHQKGNYSLDNSHFSGVMMHINGTINILNNSVYNGAIYTENSTQLRGLLNGKIYTKNFHLNTSSSKLNNYLINTQINPKGLPKQFIDIPLFNSKNQQAYVLIKNI